MALVDRSLEEEVEVFFPFAAARCQSGGGEQSIILFVLYMKKISFEKGSLFLNRSRFDKVILYSSLNLLILSIWDGCLFLFISFFIYILFLPFLRNSFWEWFFFFFFFFFSEKMRQRDKENCLLNYSYFPRFFFSL